MSFDFGPDGTNLRWSTTTWPDHRFAGMYTRGPYGEYLTRYRIENPNLASWETRDPSGEAGGINLYGYAGGNGVMRTDALGLCDSTVSSLAASFILAVNGYDLETLRHPDRIEPVLSPWSLLLLTPIGTEARIAEGATMTVGRWMSPAELSLMENTGRVVESDLNGVTNFYSPPDATKFARQALDNSVHVEFDVPKSAVGAYSPITGEGKIYGPNSIFGRAKGITEMPPATNIRTTSGN